MVLQLSPPDVQYAEEHGINALAAKLHRRYHTVRRACLKAGIQPRPGRPVRAQYQERNARIRELRQAGQATVGEIAESFGLTRSRVYQITA